VLRHAALALCALEDTGRPGANPQLRLEAVVRIAGTWVRVLGRLVGEDIAHLPEIR
jgi:hypothetical protein